MTLFLTFIGDFEKLIKRVKENDKKKIYFFVSGYIGKGTFNNFPVRALILYLPVWYTSPALGFSEQLILRENDLCWQFVPDQCW